MVGAQRMLERAALAPERRLESRRQVLVDRIGRRQEGSGEGGHDDQADDHRAGAGQGAAPHQPAPHHVTLMRGSSQTYRRSTAKLMSTTPVARMNTAACTTG